MRPSSSPGRGRARVRRLDDREQLDRAERRGQSARRGGRPGGCEGPARGSRAPRPAGASRDGTGRARRAAAEQRLAIVRGEASAVGGRIDERPDGAPKMKWPGSPMPVQSRVRAATATSSSTIARLIGSPTRRSSATVEQRCCVRSCNSAARGPAKASLAVEHAVELVEHDVGWVADGRAGAARARQAHRAPRAAVRGRARAAVGGDDERTEGEVDLGLGRGDEPREPGPVAARATSIDPSAQCTTGRIAARDVARSGYHCRCWAPAVGGRTPPRHPSGSATATPRAILAQFLVRESEIGGPTVTVTDPHARPEPSRCDRLRPACPTRTSGRRSSPNPATRSRPLRVIDLVARLERGRPVRIADLVDRLNATHLDWLFTRARRRRRACSSSRRTGWPTTATRRASSSTTAPYGADAQIEDSSRVDPWIVRQARARAAACAGAARARSAASTARPGSDSSRPNRPPPVGLLLVSRAGPIAPSVRPTRLPASIDNSQVDPRGRQP